MPTTGPVIRPAAQRPGALPGCSSNAVMAGSHPQAHGEDGHVCITSSMVVSRWGFHEGRSRTASGQACVQTRLASTLGAPWSVIILPLHPSGLGVKVRPSSLTHGWLLGPPLCFPRATSRSRRPAAHRQKQVQSRGKTHLAAVSTISTPTLDRVHPCSSGKAGQQGQNPRYQPQHQGLR